VACGFFSSGSGSNAAINFKKIAYTVYNAVEQISNDIAKYRFPLTKKTATTANQNPIIQHTSSFLFA
jgi:phage portal protein BeeE